MKTVLIDVTSTIPNKNKGYISGIGKSTYWLINSLNKINNLPFNIELCTNGLKNLNFNYYNWKFKHHKIPCPSSLHIFDLDIKALWRNNFLKYDLYHIPSNIDYTLKNESFVTTIHDCDRFTTTENLNIINKYLHTAKYSRGIVTCSEYSKKEIVEFLKVDPEKVSVIYWGIDRSLFNQNIDKSNIKKFNIDRPYFFACSCNAPRKNIITALRAFKKFLTYNPEHIFVLSWGTPPIDIIKEFSNEIENKQIIFLPYVSDDELVSLYNEASLSIFISRKEGFGFPILESYACNTPIMVCRNSCIEEIAQDAGIYVGENNIDEIVDIMLMFENSKFNFEDFEKRKNNILKKFTWKKTANEYINFYNKHL